ncbi:hypothetical protein K466DRAFT_487318, partial [Polyporus arcularius HHB13444]
MSHLLTPFPATFPTEIDERCIDQASDNVESLRSCALTCRVWSIRSRLHLLRAIRVQNDPVSDEIYDFFHSNPPYAQLVQ